MQVQLMHIHRLMWAMSKRHFCSLQPSDTACSMLLQKLPVNVFPPMLYVHRPNEKLNSKLMPTSGCCSYGGFLAEPTFAAPGFGPPEDEDEYARRIWQVSHLI